MEERLATPDATTLGSSRLMRHLLDMSMANRLEGKKSAPRMDFMTSAMCNSWVNAWPLPSRRDDLRLPQVLMSVPLAATRGAEGARCLLSVAEAGKTDSSAPQSTRKERPEWRFHTVLVFFSIGPAAVIFSGRLVHFPKLETVRKRWKWKLRLGKPSCIPADCTSGFLVKLDVVKAQVSGYRADR